MNSPDSADCNQHTNKILAHPANFAKDLALPKEGLDVHGDLPDSLISTNSLNLSNCGGLYVSLGKPLQNPRLTNDFAIGFSDFGLYSDDTYMLSSSYVTPVLLSYLEFVRRTEHGSIAADASLHRIKQGRVIEPMRYRQFMSMQE
ncbi:MAG: hypothetical protein M3Q07_00370 [Pseudobdellovibrionaceae bacterium]|nr:hypothetical protein [Pseudobdellovibrionaceae bacterium]